MWAAWTILATNMPGKKDFFFICMSISVQGIANKKVLYWVTVECKLLYCNAVQCRQV
jgi:hypothetical protein